MAKRTAKTSKAIFGKNKQKRFEYAEELCREVRFQISKCGAIIDGISVYNILSKWLRISGKKGFDLPKARK